MLQYMFDSQKELRIRVAELECDGGNDEPDIPSFGGVARAKEASAEVLMISHGRSDRASDGRFSGAGNPIQPKDVRSAL